MLLQSGVADRKAKVGSPSVHLSALVEARGTQLWVASFDLSDQSFGLPRCCRTSSSTSSWALLLWNDDSFEDTPTRFEVAKRNGSRDGDIWQLLPRFYWPKFQQPGEGASYLYPAKFEWPSVIPKLSNFNQRNIQWFWILHLFEELLQRE